MDANLRSDMCRMLSTLLGEKKKNARSNPKLMFGDMLKWPLMARYHSTNLAHTQNDAAQYQYYHKNQGNACTV